tara:strand:+ start:3703 stop:4239 length:537 start_codon:yes stop_codon:yes gene_type:complete
MAKITVTGIAQWAKVFENNRDLTGYDNQWAATEGRTTIEMVLDDDNAKRVTDSGCMSRGKPDEEGRGTKFRFSRKFKTDYDWDSGAPAVYKPDGTLWDFATDGAIGNGSEALVELNVYKNKGYSTYTTRIERVKITNVVKYGNDDDINDPFKQDVTGGVSAAVAAPALAEDLSEEIPF